MQISKYTIVLYTKENGESPVKRFIDALETKMQAKVLRFIALLRKNGRELREPYTKSLSEGILELRIIHGNNIKRATRHPKEKLNWQRSIEGITWKG